MMKMSQEDARFCIIKIDCRIFQGFEEGKTDGTITARVLFDGTNGTMVNQRTRIRDPKRSSDRLTSQEIYEGEVDAQRAHLHTNNRGLESPETHLDCTVQLGLARMSDAVWKCSVHSQGVHVWCGVGFSLLVSFLIATWSSNPMFCGPLCRDLTQVGR